MTVAKQTLIRFQGNSQSPGTEGWCFSIHTDETKDLGSLHSKQEKKNPISMGCG